MFVTDPAFGIDRTLNVVRAVPRDVSLVVQHRDKQSDAATVVDHAHRLREATHGVGARLVLNVAQAQGENDALAVARAVGADGVHLPAESDTTVRSVRDALGSPAFVSRAVHDDEAGADGARPHPIRLLRGFLVIVEIVIGTEQAADVGRLDSQRYVERLLPGDRVDRQEAHDVGAVGDQPALARKREDPARLLRGSPVDDRFGEGA